MLHWMLSTDRGYHEIQVNGEIEYVPIIMRPYFLRVLRGVAEQGSLGRVSLVPRSNPDSHSPGHHGEVLWVEVESGASAEALAKFKPAPTLILRKGATVYRTALWAMARPLTESWLTAANKRLAHALGTPKKYANLNHTILTPGSVVAGKTIEVESLSTNLYAPDQVVGRHRPDKRPLKDAPVSKWNRDRQAA